MSHADATRQMKFEQLVGTHTEDLRRFAIWLSRDPEVAKDLVQDTLLRAWRSMDSLKNAGAVKSWLITTLRRENARRFERKRFDTVDIEDCPVPDAVEGGPEEDLDLHGLREEIMALPKSYREPMVLQVLYGHSIAEIAAALEINRSAVMTRLFRAREKVKQRVNTVNRIRPSLRAA